MNSKAKYILLILAILGFAFLYYNHTNALTATSFDPPELKYSKWFFGVGILCSLWYAAIKNRRKVLTKIMLGAFGISLALNLYLFIEIYPYVQMNKTSAAYSDIVSCEAMEKRFSTDLKNKEIIYFQFGFDHDIELEKGLKKKYQIKTIVMGRNIQSNMMCYNRLVQEHLKEKYNDNIVD